MYINDNSVYYLMHNNQELKMKVKNFTVADMNFLDRSFVVMRKAFFISADSTEYYRLELLCNSVGERAIYSCKDSFKGTDDSGRCTLSRTLNIDKVIKDFDTKVKARLASGYNLASDRFLLYSKSNANSNNTCVVPQNVVATSKPVSAQTKRSDTNNGITKQNNAIKSKSDEPKVARKLSPTSDLAKSASIILPSSDKMSQLARESLTWVDGKDNKNRFYIIELLDLRANNYVVSGTYGRVGTDGQAFKKEFTDLGAARKEYDAKLREKTNKGYVKVDLATSNVGTSINKTIVNVENMPTNFTSTKSTLDSTVQQLVKNLYYEAGKAVSMAVSGSLEIESKTPLGNLSVAGINNARNLLLDINRGNYQFRDSEAVINYSNKYYSLVPRKLPRNLRIDETWLLKSADKVQEELDILDLYEDTLRMAKGVVSDDIDEKYRTLSCDIASISDERLLRSLQSNLTQTKAPNHHFNLKLVNAFSINMHNSPKFDDSCGNVQKLYHGSRSCNLMGILSSNLKLPYKVNSVKAGAMFGPGIYFADNSTKSANYSAAKFSYGTKNKLDTYFMFVCEVALGKQYGVYRSTDEIPRGYDSMWGKKGERLQNDEFIVYKENQVKPVYLLEVKEVR